MAAVHLPPRLMATMRETIRVEFSKAMSTYTDMPRETWLFDYPAQVPPPHVLLPPARLQVSLAGTQIAWTNEVTQAFGSLEEGYENALKDYYKKQIGMLNNLITLLLGSLDKGERQKVAESRDRTSAPFFCQGDDHLHHRCALKGRCQQDDPQQDRVVLRLHVAVTAKTQVRQTESVKIYQTPQVGRRQGGLLCQHLRRRVPLLARVPGQHSPTGHHTPHRQVRSRQVFCLSFIIPERV